MAALAPFRALRPSPAAAARVAAVPYDVVSTDEARALAAGNPLSFLHVSRAEIDCPREAIPTAMSVYAKAASNLERLKDEAPLLIEDTASLYVYRLRMGSVTQTGVAGCYSLDEYERDIIKKHERTRQDKEDDRTRHLLALHAQTGPVFLIHRAAAAIDNLVQHVAATRPLYDFTATDGVLHTVWRVDARNERALVEAFAAVPSLYIADGHHRAASAFRARQQLRGAGWRTRGVGHLSGGGLSRISSKDPSVQPRGDGPGRVHAINISPVVASALCREGGARGASATR